MGAPDTTSPSVRAAHRRLWGLGPSLAVILCLGPLMPACARRPAPPAPAPEPVAVSPANLHGWDDLVERLVADGLDRPRVVGVFADPRMGAFDGLEFSIEPHESPALYRGLLRPVSVAQARACRAEHATVLESAERASGVPATVVAAILYVESRCGRNTGRIPILPRLARLAMANEPANLRANLARFDGDDPDAAARVRARARYLEQTFYPEVRASFEVAARLGLDPLELRGSDGGAFGAPQFLPTSYLADGVDGDQDGRIDLYDPADAAASCARYLERHGWQPGSAAERAAIWQYNHSDAYVSAVLTLARRMEDGEPHGDRASVRSSRARGGRARSTRAPRQQHAKRAGSRRPTSRRATSRTARTSS